MFFCIFLLHFTFDYLFYIAEFFVAKQATPILGGKTVLIEFGFVFMNSLLNIIRHARV